MASKQRFSPYATPSATREVLERHGLYTKYALGQNFLVNDDVVRKILELADVQPSDHVLEVGPGIGTLTAALLQHAAHVTAVEKDQDLPDVLADTLAPWASRFTLLQMDALDLRGDVFTPKAQEGDGSAIAGELPRKVEGAKASTLLAGTPLREGDTLASSCFPNKLVSNLPYAVAATVVLDYFQKFDFLESATVMVQKEVADRIAARPGTKTYGAYTVKLGLYAQPAGRFSVSPGNFFPPPHVESAVIRLNRTAVFDDDGRPLSPEEIAAVCQMADAAFATRRKTIANSFKTYFANDADVKSALPQIFERANIDPSRRGETLTQPEFILLARAYQTVLAASR